MSICYFYRSRALCEAPILLSEVKTHN